MIKEFKEFIQRGNVIDLAVAVVVGAAFTAIVKSFTDNILNGVLGIFGGKPNFDDSWVVTVGNGTFRFGAFVSAILNFLIIAFVMFLTVKAINRMQAIGTRKKEAEEEEEKTLEEQQLALLTEIRDALVGGAPAAPASPPSGGDS